jgi:hypothetical protein
MGRSRPIGVRYEEADRAAPVAASAGVCNVAASATEICAVTNSANNRAGNGFRFLRSRLLPQ